MNTIARLALCYFLIATLASLTHASGEPLGYREQQLRLDGDTVTVRVPEGYQLELVNRELDRPRMLSFASNGDLIVGSKSANVYRLAPPYTRAEVLVQLGGYPHSVALRSQRILIARTDGLYHAPYTPGQARVDLAKVRLLAALPAGGGHNSRTVAVGPDGRIYLSLGITGNCSDEYLHADYPFADRRGGVVVLQEGKEKADWQAYASGLRNPVGFDWHPQTKMLYASNNGPDHLGFEQPPEYFSHLEDGSFHGMPWYQFDGRKIHADDCLDSSPPRPIDEVIKPVATFPARNAPMGVAFVPEGALDTRLEFDAIVALRGSWGTRPSGGFRGAPASRRPPAIVVVRFEKGEAMRVDELIGGFQLPDGSRWARPVGVALGPDGALYFTSDAGTNGLFRLRRR